MNFPRLMSCAVVLSGVAAASPVVIIPRAHRTSAMCVGWGGHMAISQRIVPPAHAPSPVDNPLTAAASAEARNQKAGSAALPIVSKEVDLVNVVYSVQDGRGHFVPGLKQGDFQVLEDNRPQQIRFFSMENQLPLTLGLLIDTSPSQQRILSIEQELSEEFFSTVVTKRDLAFVVSFDVEVALLQDLTSARPLLRRGVDGARIGGGGASAAVNPGTFPSQRFGGSTHLWDAIVLACNERLKHEVGRRALVVVSDGEDQGSQYTDRDAEHALLESNTNLYAILATDPSFYMHARSFYNGGTKLRRLAGISGGRVFDRTRDMDKAFMLISNELRTQYTLGYKSDRPERDGKFREIKILPKGRPGAKTRARKGYYAR